MNLQQAGWTPDNLEEAEMADANKGAKRPAARTPGSKDREPQPASQERLPPRGRKARKGLDDDLGRAANQEEADSKQQQLYNTTVLAEDEFHLVYLEIFPSKLETNPPAKYMCFTSASRITYEIRIKAIANGVSPSKFLKYGASDVKGKRGHYLMVVDDAADDPLRSSERFRVLSGAFLMYPKITQRGLTTSNTNTWCVCTTSLKEAEPRNPGARLGATPARSYRSA